MAKKLTGIEMDCLLRQLTTLVIDPIELANKEILTNTKLSPENIKELETLRELDTHIKILQEILETQKELKDNIYSKYHIHVWKQNIDEVCESIQTDMKCKLATLYKVPTIYELKDLIILNSNLDLQEIIEKITNLYNEK